MNFKHLVFLAFSFVWPAGFASAQAKLAVPNKPDIASVQPLIKEVAKSISSQQPKGSDEAIAAILALASSEADPVK